ncbi:LysR family transcriptional regulator [Companilactobacillus baiquanensis]|uniref:LysR substrate-binding domain-containing protein n=1 Tax=Companilactobacillus baiquanensis TaxID=2486005 RepID=A0ABW1UWL7_9LACO|nr:LysR family transcriptional regulator [Companilactobacillus baiquanensis]
MLDKRFKTLVILSETLSYTKTAKQLFVTQPAVSQQINSLENELNLTLVSKDNNKIHLTKAGNVLADYAKKTFLESTKLIESLQKEKNLHQLKMGCTLSLSTTLLPKFINQLTDDFKITTTEINNTKHVLTKIREGKIDFGLIEGNFNKNEFDSILIKYEPFICVANPKLKFDNPTSIEDLFDQNILIRELGSGSREILENWLAIQNFQINDFQNISEISSPITIIQLLKQNLGISFMYKSLVEQELDNEILQQIHIKSFNIDHPINLVFLKNSYFTDIYQQLVNL